MTRTVATAETLNTLTELDLPFTVHGDGTVSSPAEVYAPSVYGDSATGETEIDGHGWAFASVGYTGQYGAGGPGMHDSEYLGGALAVDILAVPGTYACVSVTWIGTSGDCPACGAPTDYCPGHGDIGDPDGAAILARHDADAHDGCHPDGCDTAAYDADSIEGWVVVRRTEPNAFINEECPSAPLFPWPHAKADDGHCPECGADLTR